MQNVHTWIERANKLLVPIPGNSSDLTSATYFSIKPLSGQISFIIESLFTNWLNLITGTVVQNMNNF